MIPIDQIECKLNFPTNLTWCCDEEGFKFYTRKSFIEDIRINGMKKPINVTKQLNGKYMVINGRHRYIAAKDLGWTEVPCEVVE
jgi:hypothetical protein